VLIGAVFSIPSFHFLATIELALLYVIGFFSISSLYAFNAYQGRKEDKNNERLKALGEVPPHHYLIYFKVGYAFSLVLGFYVRTELFHLILLLGFLGVAYSLPGIGKGRPLAGTIIHFFFQMIAFQMGYVFFEPISLNSILLSVYFSLLYMAGHFHHEVIDYEADRLNAITTSAVYFGFSKAVNLSFAFFTLSILYWIGLYVIKVISQTELLIFLTAFVMQLIVYLFNRSHFEISPQRRIQYRTYYRLLYFTAGLVLVCCIIYRLP